MSKLDIPSSIKKTIGESKFIERKVSNITSGWARNSNWDSRMCSRDLFQNFFDGAMGSGKPINEIESKLINKDTFSFYLADVSFDVRRLFYLGSEKDGVNTIGQVGEGFKLATLTLLRDHNVRIFAASGDCLLEISLSNDVIEQDINLRPMQYDYFQISNPCNGNFLFIYGANKELISALESSRFEFFYHEHPALGDMLGMSGGDVNVYERTDKGFGIYADTKDGLVFYHNQLRAVLPNANVVVVINKRWKTIDDKIGQDRDRTFFGDKLKSTLLRLTVRSVQGFICLEDYAELLDISSSSLPKGNSFLSAIATYSQYRIRSEHREKLRELFLGKVYGIPNEHGARNPLVMAKVKQLEEEGYKPVPGYMIYFGALNTYDLIEEDREKLASEVIESGSRQPTEIEYRLIEECFKLVPQYIEKSHYEYHVFASKQLLGQFKDNHETSHHRRTTLIYLSQDIFVSSPGELVSTVLHEVAHTLGYDGSRRFSDELTNIMGLIIDNHGHIGGIINTIKQLMDVLNRERIANSTNMSAIQDMLQRKNPEEMSRVLSKIPFEILSGIIGAAHKPS